MSELSTSGRIQRPPSAKSLPTPPMSGRGRGRGRATTSRSPRTTPADDGSEAPAPRSPGSTRAGARSPQPVRVWARTQTTAERPSSEEIRLRRMSPSRATSGTMVGLRHKSAASRMAPVASNTPSSAAPDVPAPLPPSRSDKDKSPRPLSGKSPRDEENVSAHPLSVSERTLKRLSRRTSQNDVKKRNDTIRSLDSRIKQALQADSSSDDENQHDEEPEPEAEEEAETNDQVWVWGNRGHDVIAFPQPQRLPDLGGKNVKQVCAGYHHMIMLLENGAVYAWGDGRDGRLGLGSHEGTQAMPTRVEALADKPVKLVAAGGSCSLALTPEGMCYYWGWLGCDDALRIVTPVLVEGLEKTRVSDVACGENHVIVLTMEHVVMSWGLNRHGCLGLGRKELDYVAVPRTVLSNQEFIAAGPLSGASIAAGKGQLSYWGPSYNKKKDKPHRKPEKMPFKGRFVAVALGAQHMLIMEDTGEVFAVGEGSDGQLGTGYYANQSDPVKVEFPLSREEKLRLRSMNKDGSGGSTPVRGNVASGGITPGKAPATVKTRTFGSSKPSSSSTTGTLRDASGTIANIKQIKALSCGYSSSVAVTKEGMVYVWGKIDSQGTESFLQPTLVRALDKIAIDQVSVQADQIVALVGLKNERDIRFFSFNPPLVKAATLGKLVDWLVSEKVQQDPLFVYAFFASHDVFSTSVDVIEELSNRYDKARTASDGKKLQTRLLAVLMQWMKLRPLDFRSPVTKQSMEAFLSKMDGGAERSIRKAMEKEEALAQIPVFKAPDAATTESVLDSIGNYSPLQVAQQLTLVDKCYFDRVKPVPELTHQNWMKTAKRDLSPNVLAFIGRFNQLFYFIVTDCIAHEETSQRSSRFHFWAEVHKHSVTLANLNASVCIASALNSVPIRRLAKREFIVIKPAVRTALEDFRKLLSDRNKTGYREMLAKRMEDGEPAIPYLATVLSDLTFIEEGNKNTQPDGLIHFYKFHLIGKQLHAVEELQKRSYATLVPDEALENLLGSCQGLDEELCDEVANAIVAGKPIAPLLHKQQAKATPPEGSTEEAVLDNQVERLDAEARQLSEDPRKRVEIWNTWLTQAEKGGDDYRAVLSSSCALSESVDSVLLQPLSKPEAPIFQALLSKLLASTANVRSIMKLLQAVSPVASVYPDIREEAVRLLVAHEFNALAEMNGGTMKGAPVGFFEMAEEEVKRSKARAEANLIEAIDFDAIDMQVYHAVESLMPVLAVPAMNAVCEYDAEVWDGILSEREAQVTERIAALEASAFDDVPAAAEDSPAFFRERLQELEERERELEEALMLVREEIEQAKEQLIAAKAAAGNVGDSDDSVLLAKEVAMQETLADASESVKMYLQKTYLPLQLKLRKRVERQKEVVLKKGREFCEAFETLKLSLELCTELDACDQQASASIKELTKLLATTMEGYDQIAEVLKAFAPDEYEHAEEMKSACEALI